jgi:DNA/RNA-binding domain of Phe-tRNA-synthetase-like protein
MTATPDPPAPDGPAELGWIEAAIEDEFPGLALVTVEVACRPTRTAPWVVHRLRDLSNRITGAYALQVRQLTVPALHRAFFRQLGLDPDKRRPPMEQAIFDRLWTGGFPPEGMPGDALLVGLLETGVAVWAVDAATVSGSLGVRTATAGESVGEGDPAPALRPGELVIADDHRPIARLFDPVPPPFAPSNSTLRVVLFVLQVPGVPAMAVQESLSTCRKLLRIA